MVGMKLPEFLFLWNLVHKFPSQVMVSLEEDKGERGEREEISTNNTTHLFSPL
jgi:hypothetical protein